MRGIQQNLDKFSAAGITPIAISVDPPETSREMAEHHGFTFPILSDPDLDAIKKYDLVHENGLEEGVSLARPGEFLIDSSGTVRWLNITENYWLRANPEDILEKARALP